MDYNQRQRSFNAPITKSHNIHTVPLSLHEHTPVDTSNQRGSSVGNSSNKLKTYETENPIKIENPSPKNLLIQQEGPPIGTNQQNFNQELEESNQLRRNNSSFHYDNKNNYNSHKSQTGHKVNSESNNYYRSVHTEDRANSNARGYNNNLNYTNFNQQQTFNDDWSSKQNQQRGTSGMSWRKSLADRSHSTQNSGVHNPTYSNHNNPVNSETKLQTDQANIQETSTEQLAERQYRAPPRQSQQTESGTGNWQANTRRPSRTAQQTYPIDTAQQRLSPGSRNTSINVDISFEQTIAAPHTEIIQSNEWTKETSEQELGFDPQAVQQWLHSRASAAIAEFRTQQNRQRNNNNTDYENQQSGRGNDLVNKRNNVQPTFDSFYNLFQQAAMHSNVTGIANIPSNSTEVLQQYHSKRPVFYPAPQQPMMMTAAAPAYQIVTDGLLYYQAPAHAFDMYQLQQ